MIFFALAATLIALNVAERVVSLSRVQVSRLMSEQLRDELHDKILRLSIAYHITQTPGRLVSRITSDVRQLQTSGGCRPAGTHLLQRGDRGGVCAAHLDPGADGHGVAGLPPALRVGLSARPHAPAGREPGDAPHQCLPVRADLPEI